MKNMFYFRERLRYIDLMGHSISFHRQIMWNELFWGDKRYANFSYSFRGSGEIWYNHNGKMV